MKKSKLFLTVLLCLTAFSLISCTSPVASSVTSGTGTSGTDSGTSVTLSSIAVSGSLASALYYVGDRVNTSGLTVTATYSDGSTKTVTNFTTSGFSSENVSLGTEQTITISYTEGSVTKTATVNGKIYVAAAGAKPTESPVLLSDYTGTLTGGTYYKFGDFPQTISALTGDSAYSSEPVYNGWYLGSDGYFYAKCTENAYRNSTYSNGTTVAQSSANSQKYFKVEPIVWRVLNPSDSGNKILLAESILTTHRFDDDSNNYKDSEIRSYLNNGFINTAFTSTAKGLIATTSVDNSAESTKDADNILTPATTYACDNTEDKIFLLSVKEATTEAYGFTACNEYGIGNSRIRVTTDYAKANYALQETEEAGGKWWLRSPVYVGSNTVCVIDSDGNALFSSFNNYESIGVVPALTISIGN